MSRLHSFFWVCMVACVCLAASESRAQSVSRPEDLSHWGLWYDRPAGNDWNSALPIGNGRLGAMIFGGVVEDRIQLNEDTLWSGSPNDPSRPNAHEHLEEIRNELFNGSRDRADQLYNQHMMGRHHGQKYQTVGNLWLSFPDHQNSTEYTRQLDLDTAIARTRYTVDGVTYTREYLATPVDQLVVIRLTASEPGKIDFSMAMDTPMTAQVEAREPGELIMTGINQGHEGVRAGMTYEARVRVLTEGGSIEVSDGETATVAVSGADAATIQIAIATSYVDYTDISADPTARNNETFAAAEGRTWEAIREEHIAAHQELFRRVTIDLGTTGEEAMTTDRRRSAFAAGGDPDFAALYFQYGRYLLIASSRPGTQPANLQGIWNDQLNPPWDSKYTTNINFEMNYWPAEVANLPELVEPYVRLVREAAVMGAITARNHYNAKGWVLHHNTDIWRLTTPIDGAQFGAWPTGAGWLTLIIWEHYLYGGDKEYLADVYPLIRGAAEFLLDYAVEDPRTGWLVSGPTVSPEHGYRDSKGSSAWITYGTTMDAQIMRDVWENTIEAAEILDVTPSCASSLLRPSKSCRRCRSAVAVSCRNGLRTSTWSPTIATFRTSTVCIPAIRSRLNGRRSWPMRPNRC